VLYNAEAMNRTRAPLLTLVLSSLLAPGESSAQGMAERCGPALAAAEDMSRYVVDCAAALSVGGFGARTESEAQLVGRLRSYNAAAVYLEPDADVCVKLVPAANTEEASLCRVYFMGLRGRVAECRKLPPVHGALCRDGEAYRQASKTGRADACGPSPRCRALMEAPEASAPKVAADFNGFTCAEPLHSAANRKAVTDALSAAQLCLGDTETVVPLARPAVAEALDARAEKLARLRLALRSFFAGPPAKKAATGAAR